MLNFRVGNLVQMMDELEAKGIEVITKKEWNSEVGNKVGFEYAEAFRRITLKPIDEE